MILNFFDKVSLVQVNDSKNSILNESELSFNKNDFFLYLRDSNFQFGIWKLLHF